MVDPLQHKFVGKTAFIQRALTIAFSCPLNATTMPQESKDTTLGIKTDYTVSGFRHVSVCYRRPSSRSLSTRQPGMTQTPTCGSD
eukprot:4691275-Amphidinium_carterae.1